MGKYSQAKQIGSPSKIDDSLLSQVTLYFESNKSIADERASLHSDKSKTGK